MEQAVNDDRVRGNFSIFCATFVESTDASFGTTQIVRTFYLEVFCRNASFCVLEILEL